MSDDDPLLEADDADGEDPASRLPDALALLPAAVVAALFGRTLGTLSNWDRAGVTHPVLIRGRRFYRRSDIEALAAHGTGGRGARAGSPIKYLCHNRDNGT
ncbi:hypothetical protein [Sabulicella rubraurantiaca]|uniref:hypothetical protein n=1 Tax=Sabulicella rubraurantiaca TaxID=2811429 RepID=UPI001A95FB05|nr:hypothetical protein [Sabulicella rubraurantiaca]